MKPFHTISIPHADILEGRLTMDVFAADLWEVCQNRGPEEYRDSDLFFRKTYLTDGLKNLMSIVEKRLKGMGGDPIIQIQTPFGGGKTHSLIALYHNASTWGAKRVVVSGTALSKEDTLWGILEYQLTGKIDKFDGYVSPGKEAIRNLLVDHQPVLILMDEVLEYVTKAAGVKVEESTLAAQTMAFMQELTEAAITLENVCLAITLPASILEHYDERAEKLFQQIQKIAGRVEKIYTPVQESEITKIIRRRLFTSIDENTVKNFIYEYSEYMEKEGILPPSIEPSEYRDRFNESYPFTPEVIDVLYHRWGSFPTFQRTRGVLRLLSLVIHSVKDLNIPCISLADFNLSNQEIKQELLKHIGPEFNSIIAADITDFNAGSKKVDDSLGSSYRGLKLGSRTATTVFMYSFSGGMERGTTIGDIKRSSTTLENPASVIAESAEQLKLRLFYLQFSNGKFFFNNQPNLNRIILTKMDNIKDDDIVKIEKELLTSTLSGDRLKIFLWVTGPDDIKDNEELKLVILKNENTSLMNEILKRKGQSSRIYRNTIFFLYPLDNERSHFTQSTKKKLAYKAIDEDPSIKLLDEQKKEIKRELKNLDEDLQISIRKLYRKISIPGKDGLKTDDIGIPTYGESKSLDDEVYETLRTNNEILERIAPLTLKAKYLAEREYAQTELIYQSSLKTPGEARPINRSVFEKGIAEGVENGLFGLGELIDDACKSEYYKKLVTPSFLEGEVIIIPEICQKQLVKEEATPTQPEVDDNGTRPQDRGISWFTGGGGEGGETPEGPSTMKEITGKNSVKLKFKVPRGKVSNVMGIMNLLQSKFDSLEIEIIASEGSISDQDYEDKIMEAFRQLGIYPDG